MSANPPATPLAGPWENISATELADTAGYFARKVAAEPVTFDAVTLRPSRVDCWACGGSGGGDEVRLQCVTCRGRGFIERKVS